MEIYDRLPYDVKREIVRYFRHPLAQALHDYPWVIPQIINQWPPPPTTEYRIKIAKMVNNPKCLRRCGCIYYEQHQVCCEDLPEEQLDSWDPVVRSTPIMQGIEKMRMCDEILKLPAYKCGCPWDMVYTRM